MILCVLLPAPAPESSSTDADLVAALLDAAPRVVLEPGRAWLDVRGLDTAAVHARLLTHPAGAALQSGAATRPIVALVAARRAAAGGLEQVPAGEERAYLEPVSLAKLGLEDPLLGWLADVGIERCGELAAVAREALEVRFGGEVVRWWQWSGGVDERRLFAPVPPPQPHASIDFIDYVVTDPERLIFTTNALLGGVCERLRESGAHARRLRLRLPLANGTVWERTLRSARPTADRAAWLRLARAVFEQLTVPDAVAGVAVEVEATEAAGAQQGDLFDAGFGTAAAVESAVARLLEDQGPVLCEPATNAHPLAEVRGSFRPLSLPEATAQPVAPTEPVLDGTPEALGLTLQLLPEPRAVLVETKPRRDHEVPTRYRDGGWHTLLFAAGPDRVSGGQWDAVYAREYYRAVRGDGTLVWLYRDGRRNRWYLHGWWD
jgi:protein ImuB